MPETHPLVIHIRTIFSAVLDNNDYGDLSDFPHTDWQQIYLRLKRSLLEDVYVVGDRRPTERKWILTVLNSEKPHVEVRGSAYS